MNTEHISASATRLLVEADRLETRYASKMWDLEEWRERNQGKDAPVDLLQQEDELRREFEAKLRALYLSSVALLDAHGLSRYLAQFYDITSRSFDSKAAGEFESSDEDWPPLQRSVYLAKLRLILSPLGIDASANFFRQQAGIKILETTLEGTTRLLKLCNVKPKSEAEVCRPVRELIKVTFTGAHKPPAGRFNKSFKYYKPDILVPDLLAAIEYKYIRTLAAFNSALGEIADDVGGYGGDPQYKLFYAVFYFTSNILTQKEFAKAWGEKRFPKEWVPIYVQGTS